MTVKLLAVTALVGCTHHAPLAQATLDITERDWLTIETNQGEVEAYAIPTANGISFQLGNGTYVDPGNVVRVHDERTLRGAGEGFLIGSGIGFVGGAVIGFADGDDPPCSDTEWICWSMTAGEKAVFLGVFFGGLGGIVGLAVGAIRGSQFIYENTSSGVAITPVGPAGSVAGLTITY